MHPESSLSIESINQTSDEMLRLVASSFETSPSMYVSDFIIMGIIDRAISISTAFIEALRAKNYTAATILLRTQIDTAMRTNGLFLVSDFSGTCEAIFKGVKFDSLRDREGHKLKDFYLKKKIGERHPWVVTVYEKSSGFVHFSNMNIFATMEMIGNEGHISIGIGGGGTGVPDDIFDELAAAFAHVLKIVSEMVAEILTRRPRKL